MLVKLIVIAVIAFAGIYLYSELATASDLDAEASSKNTQTIEIFESLISKTDDVGTQNEKTKLTSIPKIVVEDNFEGQVFEVSEDDCKLSVPSLAESVNGKKELTHIITLEDCDLSQGELVEVKRIITSFDDPSLTRTEIEVIPSGIESFENIQLILSRDGSGISVKYLDDSGFTKNVEIFVKNNDGELFSVNSSTSNFETIISDVGKSPYVIEVIVYNDELGNLVSTTYVPDKDDFLINPVLKKE